MEGQNNAQFDLFRDFLFFMEWQRARPPVTSSAVSSSAPVQSSQRLIYTTALSGVPFLAVLNPPVPSSLPAPVSGSRGVQGQQGRPLLSRVQPTYSARLRRATGTARPSHEGDRSWGAPSWGTYGEGVPTAVGGQDYLGPYHGEYYYPSDPYRSHFPLEPQPPRFLDTSGTDFDPSFPSSANSEADISDVRDVDNYRGVDSLAIDKEARSILIKYMGDLYRDALTVGEPSGAGSELSEWESVHGFGLFADASRPNPGIKLPSEFATEFQRLDKVDALKPVPRGSECPFLLTEPEQSRFFGPKTLAPDTIAFADSLRDPASATKSPLESKEYKRETAPWAFISRASSLAGRLAIYSAALADILVRADELEVSEEDRVMVRALILELSAMQFSQFARMRLLQLATVVTLR